MDDVYPQPNFQIIRGCGSKNEHTHRLPQHRFHWTTFNESSVAVTRTDHCNQPQWISPIGLFQQRKISVQPRWRTHLYSLCAGYGPSVSLQKQGYGLGDWIRYSIAQLIDTIKRLRASFYGTLHYSCVAQLLKSTKSKLTGIAPTLAKYYRVEEWKRKWSIRPMIRESPSRWESRCRESHRFLWEKM